MAMRIRNYTPHDINIYTKEDIEDLSARHLKLKTNAVPVTIKSEGVLNAKMSYKGEGFNVTRIYEGVDSLPDDLEPGDLVIVSALYASAVKELNGYTVPLRTVYGAVYDEADHICGCIGLCRI